MSDLDEVILRILKREKQITVRGLYYRVVSTKAFAKYKAQGRKFYQKVQRHALKLRKKNSKLNERIEDSTRRIEVGVRPVLLIVEKDSIAIFLKPIALKYGVSFVSGRGFASHTTFYKLKKQNFSRVLVLSDLDPSGFKIYQNIKKEFPNASVEHVAVVAKQIKKYRLVGAPLNPKDARYKEFTTNLMLSEGYELDAFRSATLKKIVEKALKKSVKGLPKPRLTKIGKKIERLRAKGLSDSEILARLARGR